MTQTKLGELLGVKSATISGYENEVNEPSLDMAGKISKIFNVSVDDLLFTDLSKEAPAHRDPRMKKSAYEYMQDLEHERMTEDEVEQEVGEQNLGRINELLELRVRELEREIKRNDPELAKELGIK
jgi:transcriptional regulator with XRE-family HTH domain